MKPQHSTLLTILHSVTTRHLVLTPRYRRTILAALTVFGTVFFTGCSSTGVKLNHAQREVAIQLAMINPQNDPLPAATPIIDVHTHTFNARYLPLRGILRGKRDAYVPWTWLITDNCAALIAQGLIDQTELAKIPGQTGISRTLGTKDLRATGRPGILCRLFLGIIDEAVEKGVWSPDKSPAEQMKALDQMVVQMNAGQKLALRTVANMMGMQDHTKGGENGPGTITGTQAAARFIWTLTQSDAQMAEFYRLMHANVPVKGRITMVSHMMDLGPVYDQEADGANLLRFQEQQVTRMAHYQNEAGSGLFYFVAYSPYRDHLPDAKVTSALDLVNDAINNHGAKGVKIYPPSGYRPTGNKIKPRPCALFTRYPGQQWDARYAALGDHKNEAMDAELTTLLELCMSNDVPVLVHSGYGEFEARKGYGEYHSNPKFWKQFLESHSKPGEPCKLRLCLGHAGGEDYWFGTGAHGDWGRCAYELCTQYPNVYCEITTSDAMIESTTQAFFVDRLAKCFTESTKSPYPFAKKLMYGTDWPLPDKGEPAAVLLATEKAFLHPSLKDYYADYFSGNARRYLKFEPKQNE